MWRWLPEWLQLAFQVQRLKWAKEDLVAVIDDLRSVTSGLSDQATRLEALFGDAVPAADIQPLVTDLQNVSTRLAAIGAPPVV